MNKMKKLLFILSALIGLNAAAQSKVLVQAVTKDTPLTLLSGGKYTITEFVFANALTNTGTIWFYDSTSNSTNYVQGAYTAYTSYATNYSTTFTNTAGIVITNTFSGTYRGSTSVAASTNERPVILGPFYIAGSAATEVSGVAVSPNLGLTVRAESSGTLQVTYRETNP